MVVVLPIILWVIDTEVQILKKGGIVAIALEGGYLGLQVSTKLIEEYQELCTFFTYGQLVGWAVGCFFRRWRVTASLRI